MTGETCASNWRIVWEDSVEVVALSGARILRYARLGDHASAAVRIYQCQKQWDELQSSSRADVRFCDHCRQEVHRVVDVDGFERAVAQVQCVMVAGYDHAALTTKSFVCQPGAVIYEADAVIPVHED
jgi:hypothetical protein